MKLCKKCGETKPTTEFHNDISKRDGLRSLCKACVNVANAKWQTANPDKHKASTDKWRAANPDKVKAACDAWKKANREKNKADGAIYRATNTEKRKAAVAKWAAANPEKMLAYNKKWKAANPESDRIHKQNRRARKLAAGGKLSQGLADRLFKLQRGKCACGCKQPLGDDFHMDHIMPLALGGVNEDWNIQLLRQRCNNQKHAKHPVDFMQQRGFLL